MTTVPLDECICFEKTVKCFLNRQKKRLEKKHGSLPMKPYDQSVKDAMFLVQHASHILKTLYKKRISLSAAIRVFGGVCEDSVDLVKRLSIRDFIVTDLQTSLQEILTHFFIQYIRTRDGFVLLTSGECRHEGDLAMAKSENNFFSRLTQLAKRNDGYTSLFSSNRGYSGYGWDEFHNEGLGVRRRLLDALRICCMYPKPMTPEMMERFLNGASATSSRENIWEKLIDSGAEMFESSFDRHENEMKDLQRQLECRRAEFVSNLEKTLSAYGGGRLVMITEDKFEKLEMKFNSLGLAKLCIQRQGNTFRGKDCQVAIPSNYDESAWKKVMGIPEGMKKLIKKKEQSIKSKNVHRGSLKGGRSKRKRVVIPDSDEEDSDHHTVNNSLKVTVKKLSEKQTSSGSIYSIKKQMGVDVNDLERGREEVEAEEKGTKEAALADELGVIFHMSRNDIGDFVYSEETAELNESILEEEDNIHLFRTVCKRKKDSDEAWDARESLRFSLMSLGIHLLDYHSFNLKGQDYAVLKKAEESFLESIEVIEELVQMNEVGRNREIEEEYEFRRRSLLLLSGRAHTNLGKTYYEQSEFIFCRKNSFVRDQREYRSKLALAVRCLKNAEKDATTLKHQAEAKSHLDNRAKVHKYHADTLLAMTWRFQGHAFQRIMKEEICIGKLKRSAGLHGFSATSIDPNVPPKSDIDEIEAKVALVLEQYDGACSLISVSSSLSTCVLRSATKESWGQGLFNILCEAYDRAVVLSEKLEIFCRNSKVAKELITQHGIRSSTEIRKLKDEAIICRKNETNVKLKNLSDSTHSVPNLQRNDLLRNECLPKNKLSGSIVIDGTTRKTNAKLDQKNNIDKKKIKTDGAFDGFGIFAHEDIDSVNLEGILSPQTEFRKWGDELFVDQELNVDSYPSSEPKRPTEMIECIEDEN